MKRISVFTKGTSLAAFVECNTLTNYVQQNGSWKKESSIGYLPIDSSSIANIRKEMERVIMLTGDSKIVACGDISGIPFTQFQTKGYYIFTIQDIKEETLDGILSDIEKNDKEKRMREEIIKNARPVETDTAGIYFLDLIMLQKECPEVSSKKALKEFLSNTPFLELRVKCAHIPPWLEQENLYDVKARKEKDGVYFCLTKKQCN